MQAGRSPPGSAPATVSTSPPFSSVCMPPSRSSAEASELGARSRTRPAVAVGHQLLERAPGRRGGRALITTTSSTVCATSARTCLESSTVPPLGREAPRKPRSQRMPSGSRPLAGSSRTRTGVAEQGAGQAEALAHARARTRRPAVGGVAARPTSSSTLVDPAPRTARPRRRSPAGGCARCGRGGRRLEHHADLRQRVGEVARSGRRSIVAVPAVGVDEAEQRPQRRRLARRRSGRGSRRSSAGRRT